MASTKKATIPDALHYAAPQTFHGWSKLEPNEQTTINTESSKLAEALHQEARSCLAQGEHLFNLRSVLEPKKMFITFLDEIFAMSRATAYRRIDLYLAATKKMPANVLEMAIQKGTKITPKLLESNPPPKTTDPVEISTYLSTFKTTRVPVDKSSETILKECVNFVSTRLALLPSHHKTRAAFMRTLVGMLLTRFGVSAAQSFSPVAIPSDFITRVGRPARLVQPVAASATTEAQPAA
jgi:hypothetical protein